MLRNKTFITAFIALVAGITSIAMTASENKTDVADLKEVVLEGTVYDANSEDKLEGVKIEIAGIDAATKTNQKGEYTIAGLEEGKQYTLTAAKKGYKKYEKKMTTKETMMSGQKSITLNLDIELEPKEED